MRKKHSLPIFFYSRLLLTHAIHVRVCVCSSRSATLTIFATRFSDSPMKQGAVGRLLEWFSQVKGWSSNRRSLMRFLALARARVACRGLNARKRSHQIANSAPNRAGAFVLGTRKRHPKLRMVIF